MYDINGQLIADAFEDSFLQIMGEGRAEEDADKRYSSVLRTIRTVMEKGCVDPALVAAIGLDGQMAGIMGIDRQFNAVTPYDSWLDTRCEKYMQWLRAGGEDDFIRLTGCPVTYAHGPKVLWWKNEHPEVYAKIDKFIMMNTYIAGKMTGMSARDAYIDYTQLHFSGFADVCALKWIPEMLSEYGLDIGKMPRIAEPWEVVGKLSADQAMLCGLRKGIPVVAGCGDQPATALGAGVFKCGDAFDVSGTASLFACCVDEYKPDVEHKTLIFSRAIMPGYWLPQAYVNGGGLSVRWFKELCEENNPDIGYAELENEAANLPPGSGDLMFVPHFQGRVCPNDPYVRGSFAGLNWTHKRGNLFRAVMESLGYEYSLYLKILRSLNSSFSIDKVIVTGGGAKSAIFNQIKADILGVPYHRPLRSDAPMLGCVLNAGYGVGIYPDLIESAKKMVDFDTPVMPDEKSYGMYQKYTDIYPELLTAMGKIYQKLI